MNMTVDDLRKVARFAQIDVPEDQLAPLLEQLAPALAYMAGLPDLDPVTVTREVPCNVFHDDVPGGHLSQQALLQNAPQQEAGCILVPRVLE